MAFPILSIAQIEISLDGQWEIIFDDENEGRAANWMEAEIFDKQAKQPITVPSAWELIKQDYEGVAFYKKTFDVPVDWKGKVMRLQFGAVNYLSEIWVNDEVVGFHEGGFTPFEFRVDEMIKAGESNTLILRVVGPIMMSDKEIDGIRKQETAQWRGGLTAGIWQEVKLVTTGEVYIEKVYIEPNIQNNTAAFHVELDHTGIKETEVILEINLVSKDDPTQKVVQSDTKWALHPGKNKKSHQLTITDVKHWSPDNPHLYRAEVVVKNQDVVSDRWSERFGMRELTIKNDDFYLNGKRIYIKATFFEGLYPNSIAYPDSEEMIRQEIQLAKEAGFNLIRPWRRAPAPIWLDLADEMGVFVVGSPTLECMTLPFSTPYLPTRVENEVRRTILRDRNRACIIQWELFNELHRPVLNQLMRPMAMLVRELDPTRLILDESGGWAFGANMYLPNEYEPTKFNDIHNYSGPFTNQFHYEGYLSVGLTEEEKAEMGYKGSKVGRNVVSGLMSYVSELGYGSLPDLSVVNPRFEKEGNPLTPAYRYHQRLEEEQNRILDESGFGKLYPNKKQFYLDQQRIHGGANKRMIEAVRSNPRIDGYCIHALAGGDWVLGAGLIDIWRQPKSYAYEATKAANQPQIVAIRVIPRNVYAEKGAILDITGINDLEAIGTRIRIEIINQKGKIVFQKTVSKDWQQGVSKFLKTKLDTKKWKGTHTIKVKVTAENGRTLTENSYPFDVFSQTQLKMPKRTIALMDTDNDLAAFLKTKNYNFTVFSAAIDIAIPVFVIDTEPKDEAAKKRFQSLFEFAKKGGTIVYLQPQSGRGKIKENAAFPFNANKHPAAGLWTCVPHLVHRNPIFNGLPSDTLMLDIYENIWAKTTLRDLEINGQKATPIVASIGFDWFSKTHQLQYLGPGESWYGSDLAILPFGKGRCVVSQLRLVENLGKDPVAEIVFWNMLSSKS